MKFRGIIAVSLAMAALLVVLAAELTYSELGSERQSRFWVDRSHRVIEQLDQVVILVQRAESGERAFLISGDRRFLPGVERSLNALPPAEGALTTMVSDRSGQVAHVARLRQAIDWRAAQVRRSLQLWQAGDLAGARAAALAGPAGGIGANIRPAATVIVTSERELLAVRTRSDAHANRVSLALGLAIALLALVGLLGAVFYLARANRRLSVAMDEAARANAERERVEARLREAQRLEAIGQLTSGIAHDFNNLLQVIVGNLELAATTPSTPDPTARRLANALRAAEHAGQLTRQLLAFARRQPLAAQVVNLAAILASMDELLRATLGETVSVETVVAPDLWNTRADRAQIESAILNLAINARSAMPKGGGLTIELANATVTEADLEGIEGPLPGQYVLIRVTDTGPGMEPAALARAFEPFFTTKPEGMGAGLGLSMVYGFARQSNGFVRLESPAGQGLTARIYLPRCVGVESQAQPDVEHARSPGGVILVVEDEDEVRGATVGLLESLGYRCLDAVGPEEALALLQEKGPVDLILSDVVMPGPIGARAFASRLRELAPETPLLFTSGYPRDVLDADGVLEEGVVLLSKPYGRPQLAAKIEDMLSHAQPRELKPSASAEG